MLLCRSISIKPARRVGLTSFSISSSLSIGLVYICLLFSFVFGWHFRTPRRVYCVADGFCHSFLHYFLLHFHLLFKLSGFGSNAPDNSASSSWWYIVATFLPFRRSTTKRLSYCDVVLLSLIFLTLNVMITSIWFEHGYVSRQKSSLNSLNPNCQNKYPYET
jgi:hypothetical protein